MGGLGDCESIEVGSSALPIRGFGRNDRVIEEISMTSLWGVLSFGFLVCHVLFSVLLLVRFCYVGLVGIILCLRFGVK